MTMLRLLYIKLVPYLIIFKFNCLKITKKFLVKSSVYKLGTMEVELASRKHMEELLQRFISIS